MSMTITTYASLIIERLDDTVQVAKNRCLWCGAYITWERDFCSDSCVDQEWNASLASMGDACGCSCSEHGNDPRRCCCYGC